MGCLLMHLAQALSYPKNRCHSFIPHYVFKAQKVSKFFRRCFYRYLDFVI